VLRDDFGPDSDLDVLAEFKPGVRFSLFDLVDMQDELSEIVGRKAEIFEFRALLPGTSAVDAGRGRRIDGVVL
jgi:predicted nucleotidyltransferase